MKRFKLTREEKAIEAAIERGDYRPATLAEFAEIAQALERHKKDAVISIRLNSHDLAGIKKKAMKIGVPYQTLISEIIHHHAR